jgi:(p)ppGpp synthase/HD superfamily hydrolase
MPTLFDAIEFAARAHRDQYRKGSRIPYLVHPLSVARLLIDCELPDPVVMAGVLHDVVEDTPVTLEEVRAQFGDEVARIVEYLSEPDRKRHTLKVIASAPQDVLLVELADKLDNLMALEKDLKREGDSAWYKFNRGRDHQKWYHVHLAEIFARRVESECGKRMAGEFQELVLGVFDAKSK